MKNIGDLGRSLSRTGLQREGNSGEFRQINKNNEYNVLLPSIKQY